MFRRVLISACVLALAGSVHAATYYISTAGGGSACTQTQPCGSIATGVQKLKAGDTLYLRGGTYTQAISAGQMRLPSGTSWERPVTIAGYPGETVTLRPNSGGAVLDINGNTGSYHFIVFDHLVMDGTNTFGGVFIGGSSVHDIRLQNSEVKNAKGVGPACSLGGPEVCPGGQGIQVFGAANVEFRGMKVHDNGRNRLDHGFYVCGKNLVIRDSDIWGNSGYGIQVYDSSNPGCATGTQILGNRIHDNRGDGGVTLNHGDNIQFADNVVSNNAGGGLAAVCYGNPTNVQVHDNTFAGNAGPGIALCAGVTNAHVRNNAIDGNRTAIDDRGSSTQMANNGSPGPGRGAQPGRSVPVKTQAPDAQPPPPAPKNLRLKSLP